MEVPYFVWMNVSVHISKSGELSQEMPPGFFKNLRALTKKTRARMAELENLGKL